MLSNCPRNSLEKNMVSEVRLSCLSNPRIRAREVCHVLSNPRPRVPVSQDFKIVTVVPAVLGYDFGFRCSVDGIFADPQDCNQFLVCKNGALQRVPCPVGLHFNKELETCDLTANAKCIPETACLEDGIFGNPLNCSTFFKCDGGIRVEKACSDGLLFNPDKGICDWPSNVTCPGSNPPYWYETKKEEKQVPYSEPEYPEKREEPEYPEKREEPEYPEKRKEPEYPEKSEEPEYYEETSCNN